MISVDGERYVEIRGFEIRGHTTDLSGHNPVGILVTGASDHISIVGNVVHDMGTMFQGRIGGDAHGIAVYGNLADHPINEVVIRGNELYDLTLGSSEALVVNGNVTGWLIQDNVVHDTNNIGIVAIGYEGTAPDPSVDAARDGTIRGNLVYNVDSYGNPAYGTDRSANGIYVDGGRDVLVESNVVHDVNIGMEFASEHGDRSTSFVTARNNVIYDATVIGIAIGGYDRRRGFTQGCVIVNNTVVDTDGIGLLVQFDTRNNVIENNIFVAGPTAEFVENPYTENENNVLDHNLYCRPTAPTRACGSGGTAATRTSISGRPAPASTGTRSSMIPASSIRRRTTFGSRPRHRPSMPARSSRPAAPSILKVTHGSRPPRPTLAPSSGPRLLPPRHRPSAANSCTRASWSG